MTVTEFITDLCGLLEVPDEPMVAPTKRKTIAFPKTLGEQSQAIRNVLKNAGKLG